MTNILHYIQSNAFPLPQILKIFCSLPAVLEEDVARTIYTFPHASAGDPDGIRPQHVIDITNSPAERGKKELFQALTSFTNNTLMRNVPPSVRPVFFGASLIPLQKEGGGVQLIAIGQILHHLVAKCVAVRMMNYRGVNLAPLQLGCGVSLGCEVATHTTRIYLQNMPQVHLLLKLEFKNSFNSLRQDKMLESVKKSVPELFSFVGSAYEQPSVLYCGDCPTNS